MKKILLTAAALTLGTSAYAWMPMQDGGTKVAGVDKAGIEWEGDKAATASSDWTKTATDAWTEVKNGADVELASADSVVPKAFANWSDPTVQTAALDTSVKVASDDGDFQIAENEFKAKDAVDGSMMASAETGAKVASEGGELQFAENEFKAKDAVDGSALALVEAGARAASEYRHIQMAQNAFNASDDTKGVATTAMGGPFEAVTEYPPCRPGPGDDRCIQLYERGVSQSLTMAKGAESNVAVGGPFEPVAGDAPKTEDSGKNVVETGQSSAPMSGTDHSAHSGMDGSTVSGKTPDSDVVTTTPGPVGGPVEYRGDYPPCRPGRGDDNCIQLYERGVATRRK